MMKKMTQIINENTNSKFKVGFDLHGVLNKCPQFFSFLTRTLISAGAEVHLITGGATQEDLDFLKAHDIKYTHYFSILDYHKSIGTQTYGKHPKYGFDMISDDDWDRTKADYCKRVGIDLHIDDTQNYQEYFSTPFCLFTYEK